MSGLPAVDGGAAVWGRPCAAALGARVRRPPAPAFTRTRTPTPLVALASNGSAGDVGDLMRGFPFYNVQAIVRTWKLDLVTDALSAAGILGITVSAVSGVGQQGGTTERYKGSETGRFMDKTKLEVVVNANQVEDVIAIIQHEAFTGEVGDGKLFILPVADVVRIRTGERGRRAEKMSGGREDMLGLNGSNAHTP